MLSYVKVAKKPIKCRKIWYGVLFCFVLYFPILFIETDIYDLLNQLFCRKNSTPWCPVHFILQRQLFYCLKFCDWAELGIASWNLFLSADEFFMNFYVINVNTVLFWYYFLSGISIEFQLFWGDLFCKLNLA